jgi:hypothetical protein
MINFTIQNIEANLKLQKIPIDNSKRGNNLVVAIVNPHWAPCGGCLTLQGGQLSIPWL